MDLTFAKTFFPQLSFALLIEITQNLIIFINVKRNSKVDFMLVCLLKTKLESN